MAWQQKRIIFFLNRQSGTFRHLGRTDNVTHLALVLQSSSCRSSFMRPKCSHSNRPPERNPLHSPRSPQSSWCPFALSLSGISLSMDHLFFIWCSVHWRSLHDQHWQRPLVPSSGRLITQCLKGVCVSVWMWMWNSLCLYRQSFLHLARTHTVNISSALVCSLWFDFHISLPY